MMKAIMRPNATLPMNPPTAPRTQSQGPTSGRVVGNVVDIWVMYLIERRTLNCLPPLRTLGVHFVTNLLGMNSSIRVNLRS